MRMVGNRQLFQGEDAGQGVFNTQVVRVMTEWQS